MSRGEAVSAWKRLSSKGTTTYEVVLWQNGELTCNCPGWIIPKNGVRSCKHTRELNDTAKMISKGKAPKVFEQADYSGFQNVPKPTKRMGRMIRIPV